MAVAHQFGCTKCCLSNCNSSIENLHHVRSLYESSHESYSLHCCSQCGQRYMTQFLEFIDWNGGRDEMWNCWMPITPEEGAEIDSRIPAQAVSAADIEFLRGYMYRRERLVLNPAWEFSLVPESERIQ